MCNIILSNNVLTKEDWSVIKAMHEAIRSSYGILQAAIIVNQTFQPLHDLYKNYSLTIQTGSIEIYNEIYNEINGYHKLICTIQ